MKTLKIISVAFLSVAFASCSTFKKTEKEQIMDFVSQESYSSYTIRVLNDSIKKLNQVNSRVNVSEQQVSSLQVSSLKNEVDRLTRENSTLQRKWSDKNSQSSQIFDLTESNRRLNEEKNVLQNKLNTCLSGQRQTDKDSFRKEISELGALVQKLGPNKSTQKDYDVAKRRIEGVNRNSLTSDERQFFDLAKSMYNLSFRQFVLNN